MSEPPFPEPTAETDHGPDDGPRRRWWQHLWLRRVLAAVFTLWLISLITFAATNIKSPEDVAHAALGRTAPPQEVNAFIRNYELQGSFVDRYTRWLGGFVHGDWGTSPTTRLPVIQDVGYRLRNTLILASAALLLALGPSIAIGLMAARRRGSPGDIGITASSVVVAALPEFVVGIVLIYLLAVTAGIFPVDSSGLTFGGLGSQIEAFILPTLTLAIVLAPQFIRMTRATAIDVLGTPYVRAAVLRGVPPRRILWRHVLPNAAGPLITVIGINLVWLVGGVIVVENVFQFPGIGQRLVGAVGQGDMPTVQALAMLTGALFLATSLTADVLAERIAGRSEVKH